MSHSQFRCVKTYTETCMAIIFETSIWLLAGSTRFLSATVYDRSRKPMWVIKRGWLQGKLLSTRKPLRSQNLLPQTNEVHKVDCDFSSELVERPQILPRELTQHRGFRHNALGSWETYAKRTNTNSHKDLEAEIDFKLLYQFDRRF